jgi:hypothetical protein
MLHEPLLAVRLCPTLALPEILGGDISAADAADS